MSSQKSLYQCILDGMENGALREGFSLPEPEDEELKPKTTLELLMEKRRNAG